jgi:hypothetical protein
MVSGEGTPVAIELTIRLELTAGQVWPDGLPETVDADAAVVAVEQSGTLSRFIAEWNADAEGAEVSATVGGRYARGWLR